MTLKLPRIILSVIIITIISLSYVHQQVEVLRLSYMIEAKEQSISKLLDHQDHLVYNIGIKKAPSYICHTLIEGGRDLIMPEGKQYVYMVESRSAPMERKKGLKKRPKVVRLFSFITQLREAEAEEGEQTY